MRLTADLPAVLAFIRQHQPLAEVEGMRGIGLESADGMKAGVVYENFNGHTIWMHTAVVWMNQKFLHAAFDYPFNQLRVSAVRAYIEARNLRSLKFCRRLGFVPEATLYGAASDGGDVRLLVMRREWCQFLKPNAELPHG